MPLSFPLFGSPKPPPGPLTWLLVGLGNPGKKYADTRHNVGFQVLDRLADSAGLRFDEKRNKGLLARGTVAGQAVGLFKPQTYMNLSGEAVGPLARFYKLTPAQIFVIYDDLDLPSAQLKIRLKGGAGGHKGMTSLINHLGTPEFPRMRLGIGRPPGQMPVEAYVLQKFSKAERDAFSQTYDRALQAIEAILTDGLDYAMNNFN